MKEEAIYPQYWLNEGKNTALVRLDEFVTEEWSSLGRPGDKEFDHRHRRTTWPDKDRLEEYLRDFRESDLNEYWRHQFDHKSLDQWYHERANSKRQQLFDEGKLVL